MLILLDIDGVMLPATSWKRPEFEQDGFPRFSRKATDSLQRIISETGADILLTTSHKSRYNNIEWKKIFSNRGLHNVKVSRLRKNVKNLNRREEVMSWAENNSVNHFVIIDDDKTLNRLPSHLKSKLVQPSATVGLNDELAEKAIRILRTPSMMAS